MATEIENQNVEMQAETNLVDLAMDKKPLEFADRISLSYVGEDQGNA